MSTEDLKRLLHELVLGFWDDAKINSLCEGSEITTEGFGTRVKYTVILDRLFDKGGAATAAWGEWMGAWKAEAGEVDEEADRLSRQMAAFGGDTSARMKDLNVLIIGCRGVSVEASGENMGLIWRSGQGGAPSLLPSLPPSLPSLPSSLLRLGKATKALRRVFSLFLQ